MKSASKLLEYSKQHLFGIEVAFVELGNYCTAIEKFLRDERDRFDKTYNENDIFKKLKYNSEYETQYYDHLLNQYSERIWELYVLYPHNFRASFLTQIISFIEYELKKICDHHYSVENSVFGISDLKGNSDLEKCKKYLSKACEINFSYLDPEWKHIDNCRVIRNKLIHNQGIVQISENDFKRIDEFVEGQTGIRYKEDITKTKSKNLKELTLIIESKDFCENLLRNTESFFKKLLRDKLKYSS